MQYNAMQCNTVRYNMIRYNTINLKNVYFISENRFRRAYRMIEHRGKSPPIGRQGEYFVREEKNGRQCLHGGDLLAPIWWWCRGRFTMGSTIFWRRMGLTLKSLISKHTRLGFWYFFPTILSNFYPACLSMNKFVLPACLFQNQY